MLSTKCIIIICISEQYIWFLLVIHFGSIVIINIVSNTLCILFMVCPRVEQAGMLPKKGHEKQIQTLHLLIDIARTKKKVLCIIFIEYQKAYGRIDRPKLLQHLESLGCGQKCLVALQCSMAPTGTMVMESFRTTVRLKQGSSSSVRLCSLCQSYNQCCRFTWTRELA